ncbi:MAG: nucleotidyltransferase family protein [Arenicella sp.]|nr:nucleotidyltransferase family protein [Arenicella sp.]
MDVSINLLAQITRLRLNDEEGARLLEQLEAITDWPGLLEQIELNALAPLLAEHIRELNLAIPLEALVSLKGLQMRHRGAADARYRAMQELSAAFAEHELPLVALKGLALAPMIYPSVALRPMRDIDLLVPRSRLAEAGELLVQLGFDLPESQPSRFMRSTHQLPNAEKQVDGFTVSVEIHHDALGRDVPGHLPYEAVADEVRTVQWQELELQTLGHEHQLHQVCRHLAGLHPGDFIKMINMLDAVAYAERFIDEIDWERIDRDYDHVLNTLQCLHSLVPLSPALQSKVGGDFAGEISGQGEIMLAFRRIMKPQVSFGKKLRLLFNPSDWWMHMYYNVAPGNSLLFTRLVRHPLTLLKWLFQRAFSAIRGG